MAAMGAGQGGSSNKGPDTALLHPHQGQTQAREAMAEAAPGFGGSWYRGEAVTTPFPGLGTGYPSVFSL